MFTVGAYLSALTRTGLGPVETVTPMERIEIERYNGSKTISITVDGDDAYEHAKRLLADHTTDEDKDGVKTVEIKLEIGDLGHRVDRPDAKNQSIPSSVNPDASPNLAAISADEEKETDADEDDSESHERIYKAPKDERQKQVLNALEQAGANDRWITAQDLVKEVPDPEGPPEWRYETASSSLHKLVKNGTVSRRGQGSSSDEWEYKLDYRGREIEFPIPRNGSAHEVLEYLSEQPESVTTRDVIDHLDHRTRGSVESGVYQAVDRGLINSEGQGWGENGRKPNLLTITKRGLAVLSEMEKHTE